MWNWKSYIKKIENKTDNKNNLISLLFNYIYSIIYEIDDITKTHTHDNIILFKLLLKLLNVKYFKLCIKYNTNYRILKKIEWNNKKLKKKMINI